MPKKQNPRYIPPKRHVLPGWLSPRRLIAIGASLPIILPVFFMTLFWANDQYRNGSLYQMCDQLPVSREFIPLRREIFMDGCYIESACPADVYRVSMALSRYEVISLRECLRDRVERPDRAIKRFAGGLFKPQPKPQLPEYEIGIQVKMAETTE